MNRVQQGKKSLRKRDATVNRQLTCVKWQLATTDQLSVIKLFVSKALSGLHEHGKVVINN